jgi:hypothetical protein
LTRWCCTARLYTLQDFRRKSSTGQKGGLIDGHIQEPKQLGGAVSLQIRSYLHVVSSIRSSAACALINSFRASTIAYASRTLYGSFSTKPTSAEGSRNYFAPVPACASSTSSRKRHLQVSPITARCGVRYRSTPKMPLCPNHFSGDATNEQRAQCKYRLLYDVHTHVPLLRRFEQHMHGKGRHVEVIAVKVLGA